MKTQLLFFISTIFLSFQLVAQDRSHHISFKHFTESRGEAQKGLLLEIPYSDVVVMNNSLNSSSGFGFTMNFHGNVVVIDQMNVMPDGSTQVVMRREDGKDFYGYTPTLKAVLVKNNMQDINQP